MSKTRPVPTAHHQLAKIKMSHGGRQWINLQNTEMKLFFHILSPDVKGWQQQGGKVREGVKYEVSGAADCSVFPTFVSWSGLWGNCSYVWERGRPRLYLHKLQPAPRPTSGATYHHAYWKLFITRDRGEIDMSHMTLLCCDTRVIWDLFFRFYHLMFRACINVCSTCFSSRTFTAFLPSRCFSSPASPSHTHMIPRPT